MAESARDRLINWICDITVWVDQRKEKIGWLDEAVREETEALRTLLAEAAEQGRPVGAVNEWWWEWHKRVCDVLKPKVDCV